MKFSKGLSYAVAVAFTANRKLSLALFFLIGIYLNILVDTRDENKIQHSKVVRIKPNVVVFRPGDKVEKNGNLRIHSKSAGSLPTQRSQTCEVGRLDWIVIKFPLI